MSPLEEEHAGGQDMSQEALKMVQHGDKEAEEEKMNYNHFPITLSSGWQVRVFLILSFKFLFFP